MCNPIEPPYYDVVRVHPSRGFALRKKEPELLFETHCLETAIKKAVTKAWHIANREKRKVSVRVYDAAGEEVGRAFGRTVSTWKDKS